MALLLFVFEAVLMLDAGCADARRHPAVKTMPSCCGKGCKLKFKAACVARSGGADRVATDGGPQRAGEPMVSGNCEWC